MADERMKQFEGEMPFDGKRMVFGGFDPLVVGGADNAAGAPAQSRRQVMSYIEGFLAAVPTANKQAYQRARRDGAADLQGPRRQPHGRRLGRRRPARRGQRPLRRGRGQGRRGGPVQLDRIPRQGHPRRRQQGDDGTMPRFQDMPEMPFDAQRMIWSGFEHLARERPRREARLHRRRRAAQCRPTRRTNTAPGRKWRTRRWSSTARPAWSKAGATT